MVKEQTPLNQSDATHNAGQIRLTAEEPCEFVIFHSKQEGEHGIEASKPKKPYALRHRIFTPACLKVHKPQENRGCGQNNAAHRRAFP
jgi:hypothetical protein